MTINCLQVYYLYMYSIYTYKNLLKYQIDRYIMNDKFTRLYNLFQYCMAVFYILSLTTLTINYQIN